MPTFDDDELGLSIRTKLNNALTKVDGIEDGATDDQTGAEIKALYELEPSAFTDAQFTKLAGIETGATADQTGAEIKALYEAEADTNAFTDADHSKLDGIEAGATADQTDAEIKTAYENNADTNAFTDADEAKLDQVMMQFDTVAALLADTNTYSVGAYVHVKDGDFTYKVVASSGDVQNSATTPVEFEVIPMWVGANGGVYNVIAFNCPTDGTTDATDAFIAARDRAYLTNSTVFIPTGSYVISDEIALQNHTGDPTIGTFLGVAFMGAGPDETILLHKPASATAKLFAMRGGSGTHTNKAITGLTIRPFDATYYGLGVGIFNNGQCFARIENVVVERQDIGLHLHNETSGEFSEFNRHINMRFLLCDKAIAFERTGGDASFHGTEFDRVQINIPDGGYGIHITGTSQVFIYNSRFNVSFFGGTGTRTAIYADNVNTDHNWGNLTCEAECYLEATATGEFHFDGNFENLGTINYTTTSDGQFIFDNTRNGSAFTDANISSMSPSPLPTSLVDRDGNGDFPVVMRMSGTNLESVGVAVQNASDNGLFVGSISTSGLMESFDPGYLLHRNGFILESFIAGTTGMKTRVDGHDYERRIDGGTNKAFEPTTDDDLFLGRSSNRWKQLFAVTSTIGTSDERKKQQAGAIPDEWLDAWSDVDFIRYKWNDAVEEKGDGARWHVGVIAQRVQEAFISHGIDPFEVGILCFDKWDTEKDEEGNIIREAGEIFGVRYEEALVMEAALMRRELKKLKDKT